MSFFKGKFKQLAGHILKPHNEVSHVIKSSMDSLLSNTKDENGNPISKKIAHEEMANDFENVKKHWDFEESDIPRIKRGLLIETVLFLTLSVVGAFSIGIGLNKGFIYILSGFCMTLIGFVYSVILIWRFRIIRNRCFVSLSQWLLRPRQ